MASAFKSALTFLFLLCLIVSLIAEAAGLDGSPCTSFMKIESIRNLDFVEKNFNVDLKRASTANDKLCESAKAMNKSKNSTVAIESFKTDIFLVDTQLGLLEDSVKMTKNKMNTARSEVVNKPGTIECIKYINSQEPALETFLEEQKKKKVASMKCK